MKSVSITPFIKAVQGGENTSSSKGPLQSFAQVLAGAEVAAEGGQASGEVAPPLLGAGTRTEGGGSENQSKGELSVVLLGTTGIQKGSSKASPSGGSRQGGNQALLERITFRFVLSVETLVPSEGQRASNPGASSAEGPSSTAEGSGDEKTTNRVLSLFSVGEGESAKEGKRVLKAIARMAEAKGKEGASKLRTLLQAATGSTGSPTGEHSSSNGQQKVVVEVPSSVRAAMKRGSTHRSSDARNGKANPSEGRSTGTGSGKNAQGPSASAAGRGTGASSSRGQKGTPVQVRGALGTASAEASPGAKSRSVSGTHVQTGSGEPVRSSSASGTTEGATNEKGKSRTFVTRRVGDQTQQGSSPGGNRTSSSGGKQGGKRAAVFAQPSAGTSESNTSSAQTQSQSGQSRGHQKGGGQGAQTVQPTVSNSGGAETASSQNRGVKIPSLSGKEGTSGPQGGTAGKQGGTPSRPAPPQTASRTGERGAHTVGTRSGRSTESGASVLVDGRQKSSSGRGEVADGSSSRSQKESARSIQQRTAGKNHQQGGQGTGQNGQGRGQGERGATKNLTTRLSQSSSTSGNGQSSSSLASTSNSSASNGGAALENGGKGWTSALSSSGRGASSGTGARAASAAGPPRTLPTAWLKTAAQGPMRTAALSGGWKAMEMALGDGDGTLTVKARQDQDGMAVSVGLTDARLRTQMVANARQLQDAMQAQYDTDVDLSFAGGDAEGSGGQSTDDSARSNTSPSVRLAERSIDEEDSSDNRPVRRHEGREWIG